jgi:hypothetical protein
MPLETGIHGIVAGAIAGFHFFLLQIIAKTRNNYVWRRCSTGFAGQVVTCPAPLHKRASPGRWSPVWRRCRMGFAGQVITMRPKIPGAIKEEYEDLYERLNAAARVRGEIGRTAMAAFRHMQSHYLKDQEYALPPLKLLPTVAADNVTGEIDQIQTMCNRLKRQLPSLIEENDTIIGELGQLADAAAKEEKPEYRDLARHFIQFLEREKHILYPASVLMGEYIRVKTDLEGMREVRSHAVTLH